MAPRRSSPGRAPRRAGAPGSASRLTASRPCREAITKKTDTKSVFVAPRAKRTSYPLMRTHLVTGANSGLGLETVRALAAKNERVIMAVRDLGRGEAARAELLREHPKAELELEQVDLADLDSVRALGAKQLGLDVLINNAGLGTAPLRRTAEGVYSQFGANQIGRAHV